MGCEMGAGDFGPFNGKFFPVSQKTSTNMSGFLKILFFFFFKLRTMSTCCFQLALWLPRCCVPLTKEVWPSPTEGCSPAIVRPHLSVPQIFKLKIVAKINNDMHFNGPITLWRFACDSYFLCYIKAKGGIFKTTQCWPNSAPIEVNGSFLPLTVIGAELSQHWVLMKTTS